MFLTNATGIIEVLHWLCVGLQLITIVANIDPLVFHYLLVRKQKERRHDKYSTYSNYQQQINVFNCCP